MNRYKAATDPAVSAREIRNRDAVRAMAGDCMVLLKNNGVLPLKSTGRIALYGAGARRTVKGGTGSGDVNVRETITILEGLRQEGFTVTTDAWLDRQDETFAEEFAVYEKEAEKEAEKAGMPARLFMMLKPFNPVRSARVTLEDIKESGTDTAVYVISRNSGEGGDRRNVPGDYDLSADEEFNLYLLEQHYKNFVVLLNIGGVIDTKLLRKVDGIGAVVLLNQLGNMTGLAAADLLLGKAIPSGKLTDTWAEHYRDYPSSFSFGACDSNTDDEYYTEGIYTGYRYFDTMCIGTAYEFGYGLSYTKFELSDMDTTVDKDEVTVSVKVTNQGCKYAGKEVVQVYVSAPKNHLDHPYQELKGFRKTRLLAPGESETLTITMKMQSFASYSEADGGWILEKGGYIVRVGTSSRKTKIAAVVSLDEFVVTEHTKNLMLYEDERVQDIKAPAPDMGLRDAAGVLSAKKLEVKAADIPTVTFVYSEAPEELADAHPDHKITMDEVAAGVYTAEEMAAQLTDAEMAYLSVGNLNRGMGGSAVIGNASQSVPGAAGETSGHLLESRNVQMLELCDGPAGVRVTPEFEADGVRCYQYATAVPIAFALASSWNMELIEQVGDIVGGEMEEFGVTLWLAPGMNIHRNPLCGRNFEYYSEDPLLAGKCAAADTRGVQKHAGRGTTIKHFFANSQEDNRMFTNAHISERTMREIYLKNFEIAVREAQPMSVMTSYNLVNGVHSANNGELLLNVLRDEWGFRGIVMTDWLTTSDRAKMFSAGHELKYDKSDAALCVKAGNDLIEPGEEADVNRILEGLRDGTVTRAELQACAARMINLISQTHFYSSEPYDRKNLLNL